MPWIGLVLPWLAVAAALHALLPRGTPGRWSLVAGLGALGGLLLTAGAVYAWGRLGLPWNAPALLTLFAVLLCGAMLLAVRTRGTAAEPGAAPPGLQSGLVVFAVAALWLLIAVHAALAAVEVWYRPLFPFDATSAWATKARVWFHAGRWVPFVDKSVWLADPFIAAYTDHRPGYPIVTPLLQLWSAVLADRWDSRLVNLPWLVCLAGLLLTFYGAARALAVPALGAALFTWFLASLPLLDTHVALAGYADLFMAAVLFAAVACLALWARDRARWQLGLCLAFAAACPLVKNEGLFWAAALIPGFLVARFPGGRGAAMVGAGAAAALLVLLLVPEDLNIAGHTLEELDLRFRRRALEPFFQSLFTVGSWHLLFYLLAATAAVWCLGGCRDRAVVLPLVAVLGTAYVLLAVLFLGTGYAGGAIRFTAVNRITLALVPATLLLALSMVAAAGRPRPGGVLHRPAL